MAKHPQSLLERLPEAVRQRLEERSGIAIDSDHALSDALAALVENRTPDMKQKLRDIEAMAIRKLRAGSSEEQCSFCGRTESQVSTLFPGKDAYICSYCVEELTGL
ncbi:MAG TPA: ClpX C4-type zinc finger protein [Woeseiaceae bacterium]|jgi:DNA-directed RNA polymerase sigma subunit (sigma70/sigma32)|nr:ClpX C4-type zinc finger protein [Woeseiaceae bacterium]